MQDVPHQRIGILLLPVGKTDIFKEYLQYRQFLFLFAAPLHVFGQGIGIKAAQLVLQICFGILHKNKQNQNTQSTGKADDGVNFASTWILAALRSRKFFSVEEAQAAVSEKLEELNDRDFKKRPGSRREAYLEEEKEFMLPLPSEPYEPAIWSPDLKVGNDYLVSDGMNKYSVPYPISSKQIDGASFIGLIMSNSQYSVAWYCYAQESKIKVDIYSHSNGRIWIMTYDAVSGSLINMSK